MAIDENNNSNNMRVNSSLANSVYKNPTEVLMEENIKKKALQDRKDAMEIKKFLSNAWVFMFMLFILLTSILFSHFNLIWFLERFYGMIAFYLFFLTVLVGILRKLGSRFIWVMKYHKPLGIWAFVFAISHLIAAIFDNFKWTDINNFSFFGFGFDSIWSTYTSFGGIAFWLFVIVVLTSIGKNMSRIGFGLWKKIHYISYVGFVMMFLHAIFLGTDFKYEIYSPFILYSAYAMGSIISLLFIIRIGVGIKKSLKKKTLIQNQY